MIEPIPPEAAHLGPLIAAIHPNEAVLRRDFVGPVVGVLAGLAMVVAGVGVILFDIKLIPKDTAALMVAAISLGTILAGASAMAVIECKMLLSCGMWVFANGFLYKKWSHLSPYRWDDLQHLRLGVDVRVSGFEFDWFDLVFKDGKKIEPRYQNPMQIEATARLLAVVVTAALLPRFLEQLARGERLEFGHLAADRSQLYYPRGVWSSGQDAVPWAEVQGMARDQEANVYFLRHGTHEDARTTINNVPNFCVLQAIALELGGTKTQTN